jgi:ribosomal protein S18 acetylase RimI-like enzyme
MGQAFARGDVPFLHVRPENNAVELYRRLGFVTRRELTVVWRRPP